MDVRVVAATNQDLEEMVQRRIFRADLFYRLNVFPIRLPALRERRDDIPRLILHFVRHFAGRQGKSIDDIPAAVIDELTGQPWPGNVRELQNVIERAVIATPGRTLQMPPADRPGYRAAPLTRTLAQVERDHIIATLEATRGILGGWDGAAARLGLSRTTLISRMQRLGLTSAGGARQPARQAPVAPAAKRAWPPSLVTG